MSDIKFYVHAETKQPEDGTFNQKDEQVLMLNFLTDMLEEYLRQRGISSKLEIAHIAGEVIVTGPEGWYRT